MKILIVDDDNIGLKVVSEFMKPYGETETASSGVKAMEMIVKAIKKKKPYELFLLDIMMPEINGHELLAAIRNMEKEAQDGTNSKIIMMSALSDADNIMLAFNGQCDAYLVKPIKMERLYDELDKIGVKKPSDIDKRH